MNFPDPTQTPVPATSLLSDSEKRAAPAATDAIHRAVEGAHKVVDRVADSTVPKVRQLAEVGDAWSTSARATVRDQPLMALVAAFAVGALVGRITR